jgi:hypothetical protein
LEQSPIPGRFKKRFAVSFPGLVADVLDASGNPAHEMTLLSSLRRVHAVEWSWQTSEFAIVGFANNYHDCDWEPPCSDLWTMNKAELLEVAEFQGLGLDVTDTRRDILETIIDDRSEKDANEAELYAMSKRELERCLREAL